MSDFPIVPNTINGQPLTIYDLNQIIPRRIGGKFGVDVIFALVTDFQDGRERINHLRIRRCRTSAMALTSEMWRGSLCLSELTVASQFSSFTKMPDQASRLFARAR